jgi:hypothetical protein
MNRSRLQIAKPDIVAFFDDGPRVLHERQISAALSQQRAGWRLAQSTSVDDFISFLVKSAKLRKHAFAFPNRPETLYVWGEVPLLEMLLELKPHSYYSHYTAMRLHGLTEQVPKVVYLSHERTAAGAPGAELSQDAIDAAFQRPARTSNNAVDHLGQRIVLLNSAFTGELGVVPHTTEQGAGSAQVRVTNLERTLIDAAVRPAYSGGVFEVAKAFELAKDTLSVNAMGAMLRKMGFAYPYHQVIGYYLDRAGYRKSVIDMVREDMHFDFYLTHDMGETRYEPRWRLHVPKGF